MNRCDIDSDGKTPTRRLHGRRDNTPILEFGENIFVYSCQTSKRSKVGPTILSWAFVGILNTSLAKVTSANITPHRAHISRATHANGLVVCMCLKMIETFHWMQSVCF